MTLDEAEKHGVRLALDHLALVRAMHGDKIAMMIAGGLAVGARNFVAQQMGARAAYDLCAGLADDICGQVMVQR